MSARFVDGAKNRDSPLCPLATEDGTAASRSWALGQSRLSLFFLFFAVLFMERD